MDIALAAIGFLLVLIVYELRLTRQAINRFRTEWQETVKMKTEPKGAIK